MTGTPSLCSLPRYAERRLKIFLDGPAQFGWVFLFLFLFSIYLCIWKIVQIEICSNWNLLNLRTIQIRDLFKFENLYKFKIWYSSTNSKICENSKIVQFEICSIQNLFNSIFVQFEICLIWNLFKLKFVQTWKFAQIQILKTLKKKVQIKKQKNKKRKNKKWKSK
jgi:hypothetical protein